MKLALVSSSFGLRSGSLERQVEAIARGLASHGVEVEVVTQDGSIRSPRTSEADGVCIRQFPTSVGRLPSGIAPGLWDHIRRNAKSWDVVHLHSSHGALGLAVGSVTLAAARLYAARPDSAAGALATWAHGPRRHRASCSHGFAVRRRGGAESVGTSRAPLTGYMPCHRESTGARSRRRVPCSVPARLCSRSAGSSDANASNGRSPRWQASINAFGSSSWGTSRALGGWPATPTISESPIESTSLGPSRVRLSIAGFARRAFS